MKPYRHPRKGKSPESSSSFDGKHAGDLGKLVKRRVGKPHKKVVGHGGCHSVTRKSIKNTAVCSLEGVISMLATRMGHAIKLT